MHYLTLVPDILALTLVPDILAFTSEPDILALTLVIALPLIFTGTAGGETLGIKYTPFATISGTKLPVEKFGIKNAVPFD